MDIDHSRKTSNLSDNDVNVRPEYIDYVRLTRRTGPGAGRPAKRYRRAAGEFTITLPAREYEHAAHILAEAVTASARTGNPILARSHTELVCGMNHSLLAGFVRSVTRFCSRPASTQPRTGAA